MVTFTVDMDVFAPSSLEPQNFGEYNYLEAAAGGNAN